MATTVNTAFDEFLRDTVNLSPSDTKKARKSRDWLFQQAAAFPDTFSDFPVLYQEKNIAFGSFARRTKIRPLDDIDVILCLSATGGTYVDHGSGLIEINVPTSSRLSGFCHKNSQTLNSTKIINRVVKALESVPQYSTAEVNRRGESAVLRLTSYDWNFDVVPGFFTAPDTLNNTYYLIPDGAGHWKKTDPRKDGERITGVNQFHDGHFLNIVRIMKYWNRRPTMPSAPSYMFETMLADYYEGREYKATEWVDLEIDSALNHVAVAILGTVQDGKGIQGDLNSLPWDDRLKICVRAMFDMEKAKEARELEKKKDHEKSIKKWAEIFGPDFPRFG